MLHPSPRIAWSGSDSVAIRPRSRGREPALITRSGNPDELSWLRINHLARTRCRIEDYELVSANLSPGVDSRRVAANPYDIRWRDDAGTGEELGVREDDVVGPFHGQDVHPLGWPRSLKVPHELIGPLPHELGHVATSGPDEILDGGEFGLRPSQVREHLQHVVEADLGHGAKVHVADGHLCDELDLLGRELGSGPAGRIAYPRLRRRSVTQGISSGVAKTRIGCPRPRPQSRSNSTRASGLSRIRSWIGTARGSARS